MYSWYSPPVWSFGGAFRGDELKQSTSYYSPGPGTYDETDSDNYKKAYPNWKLGTGNRPDLYSSWNKNIGPGSYEVNNKKVEKALHKTFAKPKKEISERKKAKNPVGPGSYFPKKFTETAPVFSFGYKSDGFTLAHNAEFPGPGAYDIKNVIDEAFEKSTCPPGTRSAFTRTAPHAFTASIAPDGNKPLTPAPGHHYNASMENYDLRCFNPTWSFGKSNRDALYNDETKHVPGPGKYTAPSGLRTKAGFSILGKHQTRETNDTPGPNVYKQDIGVLRKTAPSFRIGKAERKNLAMGNTEFPGPGTYHDDEVDLTGAKGTKIGTSVRRELDAQDMKKYPGPGTYEIDGTIGANAKYSMGIKNASKKATDVLPGPGEYEPHASGYMEKNNGAIIGTSERPPLYKRGGAPGPGQYDVRKGIGGYNYKIGTGKRSSISKASDEPGPGFYNIPSAIGNIPKYLKAGYADEKRRTMAEKEASARF